MHLYFYHTKEPSATLLQLMGIVVQAGQRFASIADMQVGDGNQGAAVGTTVALLERGSRVMSAIHKRLYVALTNRLPPLYQFPFCIGLEQVSSEKLIEPLIPNELVTIEEVEQKSTICPENFCLTFVGESLALICD